MTLADLKRKICKDFNLPIFKQRWILNDSLAEDDEKTLIQYNIIENNTDIYLYLVDTLEEKQYDINHVKITEIKDSLTKTMELQEAIENFEAEMAKSPALLKTFSEKIQDQEKLFSNFSKADTSILNVSDTNEKVPKKLKSKLNKIKSLKRTEEHQSKHIGSLTGLQNHTEKDETKNMNLKLNVPKSLKETEELQLKLSYVSINALNNNSWTCTLCTLVNTHEGQECAVCTHPKSKNKQLSLIEEGTKSQYNLDYKSLGPAKQVNPVVKPLRGNIFKKCTEKKGKADSTDVINAVLNDLHGSNLKNCDVKYDSKVKYKFPTVAEVLNSNVPIIKTVMMKNPNKFFDPDLPTYNVTTSNFSHERLSNKGTSMRRKKNQAPQPPDVSKRNSTTYMELLNLDNAGYVTNVHPFECFICFIEYKEREGVVLRDCLHTFCRDCLAYTIEYCEEPEVKCPYIDAEYSCESVLQVN